jgi:pyrroloquinoline quinone (PQQ) biosynthesis protein C
MIKKENNEIFSTEEKYVHIKNTDVYFKRGLAIGLSVEQCEEVDEVPQTTNTKAYEDKVDSLIRGRYSLSEELGILRQKDTKKAEYDAYFAYCEQCKAEAKEWLREHPNGDLPQVEEVTNYLSETTDDVVGFGQ